MHNIAFLVDLISIMINCTNKHRNAMYYIHGSIILDTHTHLIILIGTYLYAPTKVNIIVNSWFDIYK